MVHFHPFCIAISQFTGKYFTAFGQDAKEEDVEEPVSFMETATLAEDGEAPSATYMVGLIKQWGHCHEKSDLTKQLMKS